MPRFRDIPQFTRWASYQVDVGWSYLPKFLETHVGEYGLDMDPDFQRGYVWTPEQKVRYVEFILRGGQSGHEIHTNNPNWNTLKDFEPGSYVLVDGKQRLSAVVAFLNNEFPVFGGNYCRDYEDRPSIMTAKFKWHVNDLATRREVLQWYLDLNCGGTVHSDDELNRVRLLLSQEPDAPPPEPRRKKRG